MAGGVELMTCGWSDEAGGGCEFGVDFGNFIPLGWLIILDPWFSQSDDIIATQALRGALHTTHVDCC